MKSVIFKRTYIVTTWYTNTGAMDTDKLTYLSDNHGGATSATPNYARMQYQHAYIGCPECSPTATPHA